METNLMRNNTKSGPFSLQYIHASLPIKCDSPIVSGLYAAGKIAMLSR